MSEQEEPVGIDLTAWEAPPPAAGIADRVIAKMREPVGAAAIENEVPARKRWWIAIGAVAAMAVVAVIVVGSTRDTMSGAGFAAVAKPSRLELGAASSADLDANTEVQWVRDGRRVVAMQKRGTANWHVGPDDKLVIDAGATVASVVASGASLRVEVHPMHVTEARLLAGSAIVSAAVSLVTVVVYEGRVEVTGSGQTVNVAPGTTVEIRPQVPPHVPVLTVDRDDEERRKSREAREAKQREFDELTKKFEAEKKTLQARILKIEDLDKVIRANQPAITACGGSFKGRISVGLVIETDGKVAELLLEPEGAEPIACLRGVLQPLSFGYSRGGTFMYPLIFDPKTKAPTTPSAPTTKVDCADTVAVERIENQANSDHASGNFSAALAGFERILACNPQLAARTYLSACRARAFPKAKELYKQLQNNALAQICLKEGFDPRVP